MSHLRGRAHLEAMKTQNDGQDLTKEETEKHNILLIVDAPADKVDPKVAIDRERIRSFKKKCKKIRLRMAAKYVFKKLGVFFYIMKNSFF